MRRIDDVVFVAFLALIGLAVVLLVSALIA